MIDKIKRTLIIKYTIIIAFIMLGGFLASYFAYRHNLINFLHENLRDYLYDEVWEAKDFIAKSHSAPTIHRIKADNKILHNFNYWFFNKHLAYAEVPYDQTLASRLLNQLKEGSWEEDTVYHIKLRGLNRKAYFLMMKKNLPLKDNNHLEIFALSNYVPIRNSISNYFQISIYTIIIVLVISYLLGSMMASRSMKYIKNSYEKQKQFVSNATHELRTPLSIMLSYAELLEYKPQDQELQNNLKDEILHMNNLIDNLLILARYDNQKIEVHQERFDINNLLRDSSQHINKIYPQYPIKLDVKPKNIDVCADYSMLRQLIYILLDNAFKYTGNDKQISIKCRKDKNKVIISVKDNGQGISSTDKEHIFERFWRADKSHHQKSLGLGLSIAWGIVQLHHGSIDVKSTPSQGTVFTVTLPA